MSKETMNKNSAVDKPGLSQQTLTFLKKISFDRQEMAGLAQEISSAAKDSKELLNRGVGILSDQKNEINDQRPEQLVLANSMLDMAEEKISSLVQKTRVLAEAVDAIPAKAQPALLSNAVTVIRLRREALGFDELVKSGDTEALAQADQLAQTQIVGTVHLNNILSGLEYYSSRLFPMEMPA